MRLINEITFNFYTGMSPTWDIGNQCTLMNTTANVNLHTMWFWWCHQKLLEFADVGGCGQGETGCIATTNGGLPHSLVVGHHGHLYIWSRLSSLQYTPHKTTPSCISSSFVFIPFSLTKQYQWQSQNTVAEMVCIIILKMCTIKSA